MLIKAVLSGKPSLDGIHNAGHFALEPFHLVGDAVPKPHEEVSSHLFHLLRNAVEPVKRRLRRIRDSLGEKRFDRRDCAGNGFFDFLPCGDDRISEILICIP